MRLTRSSLRAAALAASIVLPVAFPLTAWAYAGLGPMIPMIGNGLVLFFVFLVTILGALAYPLRMVLGKFFRKKK